MELDLVMRSNTDLQEELMQRYHGQHHKVCELAESIAGHVESSSLLSCLLQLEKNGEIYIERKPRLQDGQLRTDIRGVDEIYFDTFPSIQRKSLLYKTEVEYGDYTINHILGCAHGCQYPCYAMNMSRRWGRVENYDDWMHPRIVGNAMELLNSELPRVDDDIGFVHMSFMTDPFMFDVINDRNFPWIQNLTLSLIRRINRDGIKVTVLTKGLLPKELKDDCYSSGNEYGITLVSLDEDFHNEYEPFSASPRSRLQTLEKLHNRGLKTWVSLEPYPTPNIVDQDISDILAEVAFVDKIIFGKWNYSSQVNEYSEPKKFYMIHADEVIRFAKLNGTKYHIKEGTPRNSVETERLFES